MSSPQVSLRISDLSIAYTDSETTQTACESVSIELKSGSILGLIGASGSGKTSVGRALLGALPSHAHVSGLFDLNGESFDYSDWRESKKTTTLSYVPQEPWLVISEYQTIGNQVGIYVQEFAEAPLTNDQVKARVKELFEIVSLPNAHDRLDDYAFEFSGGELQRVVIAFALAKRPAFLIADEPTASLDLHNRAEIYKLFKSLSSKLNLGILFITHDIVGAEGLCDKIVRIGQYSNTIEFSDLPVSKKQKNSALMSIDQLKVRVRELSSGRNTKVILNGLNLAVHPGEILAIVGPSGAGKTTIARSITGLIKHEGSVKFNFDGQLHELTDAIRAQIGYVYQDSSMSLDPRQKVKSILTEPLKTHRPNLDKPQVLEKIQDVLRQVNLEISVLQKRGKQLSGGERQRVNLARALILEPKLILADEPTSALNPELSMELFATLRTLQIKRQFGILLISHDLELVKSVADKILVLEKGEASEFGPTREILANPKSHFLSKALGAKLT